jgi:hypothetical protein
MTIFFNSATARTQDFIEQHLSISRSTLDAITPQNVAVLPAF